MKVLVAYFSQTGNTERVAAAIHDELLAQGHTADLMPIDALTPEGLLAYDLVFPGSACHSADLAPPAKALLEAITPSPPFGLAGFATHATVMPHGSESDGALHDAWAGQCAKTFERASREKGIAWCGYFSCQGAPSPPIEAFIHHRIVTDPEAWDAYVAEVRQHPNTQDLAEARAFAHDVLSTYDGA